MRLLRDPVWRGSLVVLLRHYPAYAVAILVGCAALALSALSGRTFVDAAEVALLEGQVQAVPASAPEDQQGLVRASMFDATSPEAEDLVTVAMDELEGGSRPLVIRRPILYRDVALRTTPYVENAAGDRTVGVLFNAGGTVVSLRPAPGSPEPDGSGLWLPDTVAGELDLGPGDPAALVLSPAEAPPTRTAATVTGVYLTDAEGTPEGGDGFWQREADELPTWPSFIESSAPQIPILVADTDTYRELAGAVGERTLTTWDVRPEADPVRLADAERLADDADALWAELRDPGSQLSRQINEDGLNDVSVFGGLSGMVRSARTGYSATIQGVSAVRVVGMGLSWLVVALGAVALLVRRRGERQVLVDEGRSSPELAVLTAVEVVVPVALGLAAGLWASRPFVERIVGTEGTPVRPQDTALVGLVCLATVVVASFADALTRHRRVSGRTAAAARRVPWRTAVVTLAGAGAVSAYSGGTDFDTVTAVFPLAAVGAVAVILSAVVTMLLARVAARWLPTRLGPRLTFSRLARDPSAATAFLAATVAFGAVGYGLLFQVSADDSLTDKVAARAGADSVFELTDAAAYDQLGAIADRSSLVLRMVPTLDGRTGGRLVAIDPDTLGRAALWSPRFAGGRSLDEVTAELAPDGAQVPVLLVGDDADVPGTGRLSSDDVFDVEYVVVDRLDAFPGIGGDETVLVADQRALPTAAAAEFDAQVWSRYDADTVDSAAAEVGLEPRLLGVASTVRNQPSLVARGWVTDYLQAFTVLALLLGLLVLAGLHRRDREQRLLQDVTLADLGHPRGLASRAAGLELAVVSLFGAIAGGLSAYAVTRSLTDRLDPLPDLPPALVVTGAQQLLLAAVAFVAAALVVTLLTGRLGRARSVNELLHDE